MKHIGSIFHFPQAILSMALLTLLTFFSFRQIQNYSFLKKEDHYIRALGKELYKYNLLSRNSLFNTPFEDLIQLNTSRNEKIMETLK